MRKQASKQASKQANKQTNKETKKQRNKETKKQASKQTNKQANMQAGRQASRQAKQTQRIPTLSVLSPSLHGSVLLQTRHRPPGNYLWFLKRTMCGSADKIHSWSRWGGTQSWLRFECGVSGPWRWPAPKNTRFKRQRSKGSIHFGQVSSSQTGLTARFLSSTPKTVTRRPAMSLWLGGFLKSRIPAKRKSK